MGDTKQWHQKKKSRAAKHNQQKSRVGHEGILVLLMMSSSFCLVLFGLVWYGLSLAFCLALFSLFLSCVVLCCLPLSCHVVSCRALRLSCVVLCCLVSSSEGIEITICIYTFSFRFTCLESSRRWWSSVDLRIVWSNEYGIRLLTDAFALLPCPYTQYVLIRHFPFWASLLHNMFLIRFSFLFFLFLSLPAIGSTRWIYLECSSMEEQTWSLMAKPLGATSKISTWRGGGGGGGETVVWLWNKKDVNNEGCF
jgi:hypothetical protein